MGRVINREVVAIRCEHATPRRKPGLTTCNAVAAVQPISPESVWEDQVQELARLVQQGWGIVLGSRIRTYCPEHENRVWDCTCRTNPDRARLCTAHGEKAPLVWTYDQTPKAVQRELDRIGVSA